MEVSELHSAVFIGNDIYEMSASPPSEAKSIVPAKSIVLVGRTGNGKSATGNSILGRRAFTSMSSSTGVTSTCDVQKNVMENGQTLAVIDTSGLFDYSSDPEFFHKEMLKCIEMAEDGIHAIILTMSIRTRFSREEEDSVLMLRDFFGPEVMNYMILVFTGGDQFEEYGMSLDDYLCGSHCPDPLKETLRMCGNRRVLFDNKTKDEAKKSEQLKQLHDLLKVVTHNNGGKPYTRTVVDANEEKLHTNKLVLEPNTSLMVTNANDFTYGGMLVSSPGATKSIVLVGKTGNGKSAIGNSILGRRVFKSMYNSIGVTSTCDVQTTVMQNGQTLAVIDTPGLFDYSSDPVSIHKEILKCITMAEDGIHAIILTMSIRTCFSREEEDGVSMLQNIFGPEIINYIIVVFTGGDEFEEYGMSLDDKLSDSNCPDPLKGVFGLKDLRMKFQFQTHNNKSIEVVWMESFDKKFHIHSFQIPQSNETLRMCGNRRVLFDNKTKDEAKKSKQLKQLHDLFKTVARNNGGKPYARTVVDTDEGKSYKHDVDVGTTSGNMYTHDIDVCTIGRKPCKHDAVVGTTGGKRYTHDTVVGTIGQKPYKHDVVVGTTGEKPYTHDIAVGTNVWKQHSKYSKPKEGSAFHSSQAAYKGATNKLHARTAEGSSSKKVDDIFETMGDQHERKAYEGALEIVRLKEEIDILRDKVELLNNQIHNLQMDTEKTKRKKIFIIGNLRLKWSILVLFWLYFGILSTPACCG